MIPNWPLFAHVRHVHRPELGVGFIAARYYVRERAVVIVQWRGRVTYARDDVLAVAPVCPICLEAFANPVTHIPAEHCSACREGHHED